METRRCCACQKSTYRCQGCARFWDRDFGKMAAVPSALMDGSFAEFSSLNRSWHLSAYLSCRNALLENSSLAAECFSNHARDRFDARCAPHVLMHDLPHDASCRRFVRPNTMRREYPATSAARIAVRRLTGWHGLSGGKLGLTKSTTEPAAAIASRDPALWSVHTAGVTRLALTDRARSAPVLVPLPSGRIQQARRRYGRSGERASPRLQ